MNRRPNRLRLAAVVTATALLVAGAVLALLGPNLHHLAASSADSLAGSGGSAQADYPGSGAPVLGHRSLKSFGEAQGDHEAAPRPYAAAQEAKAVPLGRLHSRRAPGRAGFADGLGPAPAEPGGTEGYADYGVNGFVEASEDPLSTFAVDVDTGSYTLLRKKLMSGTRPPPQAVRLEEVLNYFRYAYPQPEEGPFAVHMDAAPSPYTEGRHLVRVALQGRRIPDGARKPAHLVFLVDVSGSMSAPDKLPLAQRALRLLVDGLHEEDTVALVTYAAGTRLVLAPTGMDEKGRIHEAIASLTAGGGTAMSNGLQVAYDLALKQVRPGSVSRVIVLSDGDANLGPSTHGQMLELIRAGVQEGVTLTTVGFGTGNYQDATMEQLANKGNGNHVYCDSMMEARRVFSEELGGTLEVIAKDVKIQVAFDPAVVRRYRLLGYENRDVADHDFRNDRVDAGEIGSGHSVTAVYEVELTEAQPTRPLAVVQVRAKAPRGEKAVETAYPFPMERLYADLESAPRDLRFVAGVVGAAERLRGSAFAAGWEPATIERLVCEHSDAPDRREFCELLTRSAQALTRL